MKENRQQASWQACSLILEGKTFSMETYRKGLSSLPDHPYQDLKQFLEEWFDESPTLRVYTSGSTGTPKELFVRKEQMMNSARITCEALQLRKGDKALLCMPLQYIAGKMVVVRALVAGLELIVREPSGHPLADVNEHLRFAAMIPLQVFNSLVVPQEASRLEDTEILIIGGGAIDKQLEVAFQKMQNAVYSTYGMTETLSHIALRRLNGAEASERYKPFPSVSLSLSADHTLVIHAPQVCDETLVTNDVVELFPDGTFQIIGRKDNIINSGGIKIQTECIEKTLRSIISVNFALTAVPHPKFGEALVLLVEKDRNEVIRPEELAEQIRSILPKYQQPKQILWIESLPLTQTGKISRAECRKLAAKLVHY